MRKLRQLCVSLLFAIACAAQPVVPAKPPPDPHEALRERVFGVRDDPACRVYGESIAARRVLPELYANRDYTPAWTSARAREDLLRAIRDSVGDGLNPEDYHLSALERLARETAAPGASPSLWLDYDLLQSDALARLLQHLSFGKVDPATLTPQWSLDHDVHGVPPARFLQSVIDAPSLYDAVERERPRHQLYRTLRAELARYRGLRARGGWTPIPAGPTLRSGARDSRVVALRARLAAAGGDAALPSGADARVFDDSLVAAVRAFQSADGLDADGAVGARTLAALNHPVDARIAQIEVNLERGRWLLHDLDPTFVVINVAGFRIYYLRDGEVVWSARVQVGRPYRQTPMFRSRISYLVLNPTWTVPATIFEHDVLPELKRDPRYLAEHGLEVVDAQGKAVARPIDWARMTPERFHFLLRQPPGPANPLGRLKFMFPNEYDVYLHDTPSQALFERSDRTFSSGCIRVERALELAALLLEGQGDWNAETLAAAIATGDTLTVGLERKVPILVFYWTAWVDRAGVLQFRRDVYELDARVRAALAQPFRAQGDARTDAGE